MEMALEKLTTELSNKTWNNPQTKAMTRTMNSD
jgi:hypothetical protein